MILIIISAFVVCAVSGIGSLKYMERQDRNKLRLLDEMEIKRAEKLRQKNLIQLENELENLQLERELLGRIYVAENINIYGTKDVKKLKKAFILERQIHTLDKKISTYIDKIESL